MITLKRLEDLEKKLSSENQDINYEPVEETLLINIFNKKVEIIEKRIIFLLDILNKDIELKLEDFYSDSYELKIDAHTYIEMKKNVKNINEIYFLHFNQSTSPLGFVYDIKKGSLSYENKYFGGFSEFTKSSSSTKYKHIDKLVEQLNENINNELNKELNINLRNKIENLKILHSFYYQNKIYKENYQLFVKKNPAMNINTIKEYIEIMCLKEDYKFQEKASNKKLKNK